MTDLTRGEIAKVTAILAHCAGILEALPLERYTLALSEQMNNVYPAGAPKAPGPHYSALRLTALRAAARHAGNLIDQVELSQGYWKAATAAYAEAADEDPKDLAYDHAARPVGHATASPDGARVFQLDDHRALPHGSVMETDPAMVAAFISAADRFTVPRGGVQFGDVGPLGERWPDDPEAPDGGA